MNFTAHTAALMAAGICLVPGQIGAAPYMDDAENSRLEFSFLQAGARNTGRFRDFDVAFEPPSAEGGGQLEVVIRTRSLDTQDGDRDSMLRSGYFFDVDFYPEARFESSNIVATAPDTYAATGRLTIRETTREITLPFVLERDAADASQLHLHGSVTIRRLDYGVGEGEWRATTWIRNDVLLNYSVRLIEPQL